MCRPMCNWKQQISPNSTWIVMLRLDRTRRVKSMHFGCVELVKQHGLTHSTSATHNLVCCVICRKLYVKLFTNLLKYTFISFDWANRVCVCKSVKTTKLVQASTIACLSSAMLEQHGSTYDTLISTRLTHRTCRVVTSQVEFGLYWGKSDAERNCIDREILQFVIPLWHLYKEMETDAILLHRPKLCPKLSNPVF